MDFYLHVGWRWDLLLFIFFFITVILINGELKVLIISIRRYLKSKNILQLNSLNH